MKAVILSNTNPTMKAVILSKAKDPDTAYPQHKSQRVPGKNPNHPKLTSKP